MQATPRFLLPESADSSLVQIDTIHSSEARTARIRLRLQWIVRILFHDALFISEGWSLDGLAFLQVASEILRAIETIRDGEGSPESIERFTPFVLERRSSASYVAVFKDYLSRPDCRWSGYPILAQDADRRRALLAALEAAENNGHYARLAVEDAFGEYLDDRVGRWIGRISAHERRLGRRSRIGTQGPSLRFYEHIRPRLVAVRQNIGVEFEDQAAGIGKMLGVLDRHEHEIFSSSQFLQFARAETDKGIHRCLDHLTRLTYMDVTATAGGASFQTPAILGGEDRLIGAAVAAAYRSPGKSEIAFAALRDEALLDFDHITGETDWSDIWESVIRLSLRSDWQAALAEFREQTHDLLFSQSRVNVGAFAKLEALMRTHGPKELFIEQTYSERLGLNLQVAKVIEYVAQAGVVAGAMVAIKVPFTYLVAPLVPPALNTILAGAAQEWFKPLTGKKHLTSTILRKFEP